MNLITTTKEGKSFKVNILGIIKFNLFNSYKFRDELLKKISENNHKTPGPYFECHQSLVKASGITAKLQNILLTALTELDKVCADNNIDYWLDSGTLLGFYRDGHVLPWDDDVDIGMLYDDMKKLEKLLGDNHRIFIRKHIGVRTNDTNITYKVGLYGYDDYPLIDIFPFDNFNCTQYNLLHYRNLGYKFSNEMQILFKKNKLGEKITVFADDLSPSLNQLISELEDSFRSKIVSQRNNSDSLCYSLIGPRGDMSKQIFSKETILPVKRLNFDDNKYNFLVPNLPDLYLHQTYGDYTSKPDKIYPYNPLPISDCLKLAKDQRL